MGNDEGHGPERIFVRKNWNAPDLLVDPGGEQPIVFDYGGEQEIRVELRKSPTDVMCRVSLLHAVPKKHREDFAYLARAEPPPGSAEPQFGELDETGAVLIPTPHRMLRNDLKSFLAAIESALADPVQRTVRLLRWRLGASGPHVPLHPYAAEWSADGHEWHGLPTNIHGPSWSEQIPRISSEIRDKVHILAVEGQNEPVAHELLREAWELRVNHRKAALAVGIAALEVGAKQVVIHLVPDSRWLVEHQPSPSVITLIREGIPAILKEQGKSLLVEITSKDAVFQEIHSGVTLRNETVHRERAALDFETLVRVLSAVRDFLWLFDAYRGHLWALHNIRSETLTKWARPTSE